MPQTFCYTLIASLFISTSSFYFLFVIAVDRFQALKFPLSYSHPSKISLRTCMVPGVWFILGLTILSVFLGWFYNEEREPCYIKMKNTKGILPKLIIVTPYLLLFAALIFNIMVIVLSRRHAKGSMVRNRKMASFNVTALLFFVSLACYIPVMMLPILKPLNVMSLDFEINLKTAALVCAVTNSVLNPLVYFFMMPDFRHSYLLLLNTPPWRWVHLRKHGRHPSKVANMRKQSSPQRKRTISKRRRTPTQRQRTLSAAERTYKTSKFRKALFKLCKPQARSIDDKGYKYRDEESSRSNSFNSQDSSSGFHVINLNPLTETLSLNETSMKVVPPDSCDYPPLFSDDPPAISSTDGLSLKTVLLLDEKSALDQQYHHEHTTVALTLTKSAENLQFIHAVSFEPFNNETMHKNKVQIPSRQEPEFEKQPLDTSDPVDENLEQGSYGYTSHDSALVKNDEDLQSSPTNLAKTCDNPSLRENQTQLPSRHEPDFEQQPLDCPPPVNENVQKELALSPTVNTDQNIVEGQNQTDQPLSSPAPSKSFRSTSKVKNTNN